MDGSEPDDRGAPQTPVPPLVALLDWAASRFVAEFERRLAASEFTDLSPAHCKNVLRLLGAGPARASRIVEQCGVSKQAVSQQIVQLERNGYLTVAADPQDQRARVLALTAKGARAQRAVRRLFAEIERDWAAQLGAAEVAHLRTTLTRLAGRPR